MTHSLFVFVAALLLVLILGDGGHKSVDLVALGNLDVLETVAPVNANLAVFCACKHHG